uniref:Mitogen-activated protein kinase n=1 Tax=Kwoniella dejecticola CBS 10117 TaxID=1296121 RepID=A0A1A5ZZ02_9TREE|nr:CMGC/MAPK protein kinase [Kwoniella dejecticola CBS 10117]OBR83043.1 CMGC/MAPK protein kinase [Kwoniella dejecticola CBS 10117]
MSSPTVPLTPPTAPLIPRSQPPRPNPSQAHSSPVVSIQQRSIPLHKQPSEPLFSDSVISSASASGSGSSLKDSKGMDVPTTETTTRTSDSAPSSKPLVTPTTSGSNANFALGALGPAFSAKEAAQSSAQYHPLSKQGLTASSSTSVSGLLSGLPNPSTGNGSSALHTPISHQHAPATSVNQTPQTGASKMAAAAKRGLDGIPTASAMGLAKMQEEEESHPLSEKNLKERDYQTIHTLNRLFHLPSRWRLIRPLGQGAYGLVINVQDSYSGEPVAVKCITRVFDKVILARRALREITLLRHFGGHENLTGLIDLDNVWEGYNEIYGMMQPMEADLHQIVRSGQALSNSHIQYFLYQLLRGMKGSTYIHTANVIHRDLKPGNLLVNSDCELKICDFGLARGFKPVTGEDDQNAESKLTEYVATRWYRAPEIMLSNKRYTTAIDVWSIGCILAELLGGKPLFKGKDYVDQLNLILSVLGTPDDETLARVSSEKALAYLKTLPYSPKVEFVDLFPEADTDALDLLSHLLAFDPSQRIDVTQALSHPYLATYHDELDEPACPEIFSKWEQVESLTTIEELREAITREIEEFRDEVRNMDVDEEYYDEDGSASGSAPGEGVESWRVEGLEDGEQVVIHASPMPDTHTDSAQGAGEDSSSGIPIPGQQAIGHGSASREISPKANFSPLVSSSPLAKRQSIIAAASASPERRKSSIGLAASGSRPRTRDASPITPATALSEESFGNPFSASSGMSGRQSRRQSGHSMSFSMSGGTGGGGRRPNSFLFNPFGQGMTPMPSSQNQNQPGAGADGTGSVPIEGSTMALGHSRERGGSGHWGSLPPGTGGRRSRAPSQSGSISHLIRKLSSVDLTTLNGDNHHRSNGHGHGEADEGEEVPPMTVSPSDAPPSEVPKNFN